MTRQVRILRRAQIDLLEIQEYIARDNPAAAGGLIEAILDLISSLGEFPERGRGTKGCDSQGFQVPVSALRRISGLLQGSSLAGSSVQSRTRTAQI